MTERLSTHTHTHTHTLSYFKEDGLNSWALSREKKRGIDVTKLDLALNKT